MEIDDWGRAVTELPGAAEAALDVPGPRICTAFLSEPASHYEPISA